MKGLQSVRFWTKEETRELIDALRDSEHYSKSVLYRGQWVRFKGSSTITFRADDVITVDGLEMEIVEPPV